MIVFVWFFKLTLQTTIGKSYAPPVLTRGGTTIGAIRSEALNAPFRKYTPDDWHRRNQGTVYSYLVTVTIT